MVTKYAEKLLDLSKLDYNKVKELRKHNKLLKSLDKWVLFADRNLAKDMIDLSVIVKDLYEIKEPLNTFRGIREDHKVSANLGLKNPILSKQYRYNSNVEAVSFSTDVCIARAFGNIIIKSKFSPKKDNYLVISNELSFIINYDFRNRKTNIMTQDEVILLPPFDIQYTVIELEKKPLWGMW